MTGSVALLVLVLVQDPSLKVGLERDRIYTGESVLYEVSIQNTKNSIAPDLSSFLADFEVESQGEQTLNSSRVTFVNGQMTRSESYGRSLHREQEGWNNWCGRSSGAVNERRPSCCRRM